MSDPKALKEVWEWKDRAYEETKHLSMKERIRLINKRATELCQDYGLSLKKTEKAIH